MIQILILILDYTDLVNQAVINLNPLTTNIPHHTETSQLIYNANQLAGFGIMGNIVR